MRRRRHLLLALARRYRTIFEVAPGKGAMDDFVDAARRCGLSFASFGGTPAKDLFTRLRALQFALGVGGSSFANPWLSYADVGALDR